MQPGATIDFYDDPTGSVLRQRISYTEIPPFVKEAHYLDDTQREKLPDDVFALVMVDQGEKLRKFACADRGNTALSVIYFLENHHRLPEDAQKVAAANLLQSCADYEIAAPLQLRKLAVRKEPETKKITKAGDVSGSDIMPLSADKTASRYVDVTGQEPPVRFEKKASQRYCLVKQGQGRFPIDSYGDVLDAQRWFGENSRSLHPEDRREYCTKLASRARELGVRISDQIRKYAGAQFASPGELEIAVATRMQHWAEDAPERDMLQGLMSKHASVAPEVFCEALRQFDEVTGLNYLWDDGVVDPWYSTFGMAKEAEWVWGSGNDRVTEAQLTKGSKAAFETIKARFGEELAVELQKRPTQIFDSLPLDHKRIISRLVVDTLA